MEATRNQAYSSESYSAEDDYSEDDSAESSFELGDNPEFGPYTSEDQYYSYGFSMYPDNDYRLECGGFMFFIICPELSIPIAVYGILNDRDDRDLIIHSLSRGVWPSYEPGRYPGILCFAMYPRDFEVTGDNEDDCDPVLLLSQGKAIASPPRFLSAPSSRRLHIACRRFYEIEGFNQI